MSGEETPKDVDLQTAKPLYVLPKLDTEVLDYSQRSQEGIGSVVRVPRPKE